MLHVIKNNRIIRCASKVICSKNPGVSFFRLFIGLGLLLLSVNTTALNCPGIDAFVSTKGLWGWSWSFRNPKPAAFSLLKSSWWMYSPYEAIFSPKSLQVGLYFLKRILEDGNVTATYYCNYELAGGEIAYTHADVKFSSDEFARIQKAWQKKTAYFDEGYRRESTPEDGYLCTTDAGNLTKCAIDVIS